MLNFTLTDLRYLVALAEEKHFAKAAQKCFVSQPTLSIAIKKLEDHLSTNIFERENHHIFVTPGGAHIIEQAKRVLVEAHNLSQIAANSSDPLAHPLRVGAILTIGPYLFPRLIHQVISELPKLKLMVEESYTHVLTEKLLTGELDVIFLATEVHESELAQETLFSDPLKVICASTNPLAKLKKIDPLQLNQHNFLLLGNGHCFRDQVLKACATETTSHNQFANLIITSSLETIKYMVAMDLGVSVLPKLAETNLPPNVTSREFSKNIPRREISIVYRKNFPRVQLIEHIKQLLITAFSSV